MSLTDTENRKTKPGAKAYCLPDIVPLSRQVLAQPQELRHSSQKEIRMFPGERANDHMNRNLRRGFLVPRRTWP